MLAFMTTKLTPVEQFLNHCRTALDRNTLQELRLHPVAGRPVNIRPVDLAGGTVLSFVTHEERRDVTANRAPAAAGDEIASLLAGGGTAWLRTPDRIWQLVATPGKRPRLVPHAPSGQAAPPRTHNQPKQHHLAGANAWLEALELTDARGRPRPGRADKIRQIERYADLLSHLVRSTPWPEGQPVSVADMGCGKGYLTFAAWHVLRQTLRLDARILGLDAQPEVIASCRAAAERINAGHLRFEVGTIREAPLPGVDVLIALHACNEATDHALVRGVRAGARVIVVAPCCHKDVRRGLGEPVPVAPLLNWGLFKERFAEWLTDGLRALALEAAGYRVTVSEFVDAEHTPKNVLIGAVRGATPERQAAARAEFLAVKQWASLGDLAVDPLVL